MSDTTNKTPGQVAELRKVFYAAFNRHPVDEWESEDAATDAGIAAVLAHAAPKWHPVSEPVPVTGEMYWVRTHDGAEYMKGVDEDIRYLTHPIAYWQGPIRPTPFQEKP